MSQTDKLDGYLREHTTHIHKLTENVLAQLDLFTNPRIENYGIFIQIQHQWHQAIEAILSSANPSLNFEGYLYIPKTNLLKKDLDALGIETREPVFINWKNPAIPGLIYVLNGSMLGGAVISKHLEAAGIDIKYRHYFTHCAEAGKIVWPLTRTYLQKQEAVGNLFDLCLRTSISSFELMIEIAEAEMAKREIV